MATVAEPNSDRRRKLADYQQETRRSERDIQPRLPVDPERRERLKNDDAGWLQTYLPDVFYFPFTSDQLRYIENCGHALRYGLKKCLAAPRGDGKSSILKYLALKYALYREVKFALIIAATSSKGAKGVNSIRLKLSTTNSELLRDDFPFECDVMRYVAPAPSRANNATVGGRKVLVALKQDWLALPEFEDEGFGYGPLIMSLGISSDDLQGCNVFDRRPDFVMLDDLDSRDSLAADNG